MTTGNPPATPDDWVAALRRSHDRLVAAVASLAADDVTGASYDDEWSIAQVLSHLGSGAEIFTLLLEAGLAGEVAPGSELFQSVWDRWNAMPPAEQVDQAIAADAGFLDRLGGLSASDRQRWQLSLFGSDQRFSGLLRMRLGEHAVHTWDVAVTRDGEATVAEDAVALLLDSLDDLVARVGTPVDRPLQVQVTTRAPERSFDLEVSSDGARLSAAERPAAAAQAALRLPAEAFLRLVYGRLDPDHTPPLESEGVDLSTLRTVFPGL